MNPSATEICDLIDNDCNGFTDDYDANLDLNTTSDFYADLDGDGEGDVDIQIQACIAPPNYVTNSTDCDDGNEDVYLAATEACDGMNNNCNNETDEGLYGLSASCPAASCLEILDAGEEHRGWSLLARSR